MPDYEKMYNHMVQETNRAINMIFKAQQECQKMYFSLREPELPPPPPGEEEPSSDSSAL